MDNQLEMFQESLAKIDQENKYYEMLIKNNKAMANEILNRLKNNEFEKGKLCWFWDGYDNSGKMIRPMIRPFCHVGIFEDGIKKYFSADTFGNSIGHGWKYCKYVTMSEIVGLIKL